MAWKQLENVFKTNWKYRNNNPIGGTFHSFLFCILITNNYYCLMNECVAVVICSNEWHAVDQKSTYARNSHVLCALRHTHTHTGIGQKMKIGYHGEYWHTSVRCDSTENYAFFHIMQSMRNNIHRPNDRFYSIAYATERKKSIYCLLHIIIINITNKINSCAADNALFNENK